MRTLGVTDALAPLPDVVVFLFALLTQLGDPWFLFLFLALLYWTAPRWLAADARRAAALLVAFGLSAAMLTVGLKTLFAFPRPPGAATTTPPAWLPPAASGAFRWVATGDGFGFPSGHALGSVVVYGGLAALTESADRSNRAVAAGVVVAAVALSRLVLGVHYLVDVVVGLAFGLAFLSAALRLSERDPTRAFVVAVAVAVGALAVALASAHPEQVAEAAAGVGGTVGGLVGWRLLERRRAVDVRVPRAALPPALVVAGGLFAVASEASLSPPLVAALDFGSVFVLVTLPALVGSVRGAEP